MLFNSHIFIFVFLPLLLAGWYFFNWKKKFALAQGYLIGMSLWFYAYVNVNYLWLLLGSCAVGWGLSLLPEKAASEKGRKGIIAAGCVFHLGLLGYFKYSNFFLENINAAFGAQIPLLQIVMPVGISFYTFQQLAYLIDRCRGDAPKDSFWDYLTFMVYFPQLLQGPILLRNELIPQLYDAGRRRFDAGRFSKGVQFFVLGLSKKVLLADTLAKAVNFGIVYGISSFGLSQDLSISKKQAAEYIEKYFEAYPGIKVYIDELVAFAKEHGYSLTMFNRRRPIPEIKSSNFMQRSFGERVAMNAPIQGTAADIIKLAMIEVYNRLKERGLKSRLILQVHDELLVEAHQDEVEEVKQLMTDAMKNAAKLAVVLEVDLKEGKNWLEAH